MTEPGNANHDSNDIVELSRRARSSLLSVRNRPPGTSLSMAELLDIAAMSLELIDRIVNLNGQHGRKISARWLNTTRGLVRILIEYLHARPKVDRLELAEHVDRLLRHLHEIETMPEIESDLKAIRGAFQEWDYGNRSSDDQRARFSRLEAALTERIGAQLARNEALVMELVAQLQQIEGDSAARLADITNEFGEQISVHVKGAQARVLELEALRDGAKRLVAEVADKGTTTDYLNYANQERRAGVRWRAGAVALGSLTVAIIVGGIFWFPVEEGALWQEIGSRIAVATVLAGLAAYAARESRRHFDEFGRAKSMQLNLVAIGPFIASLPDDDQRAVRIELAHRLFGPQQASAERVTDALGPTSGAVIAAIAEKVWQQLPGAAKPPAN